MPIWSTFDPKEISLPSCSVNKPDSIGEEYVDINLIPLSVENLVSGGSPIKIVLPSSLKISKRALGTVDPIPTNILLLS